MMSGRMEEQSFEVKKKLVEEFLKERKQNVNLTIKDFAKEKLDEATFRKVVGDEKEYVKVSGKVLGSWIKKYKNGEYEDDDQSRKRCRKGVEDKSDKDSDHIDALICFFLSIEPEIRLTEHLKIMPCMEADAAEIHEHIFGDQEVMAKFATGKTRDMEYTLSRVRDWEHRWLKHVPFSGFTVRMKDDNTFLGIMVLGGSDEANSSEIAGLLRKEYWKQGFASEAMDVLMSHAFKLKRKEVPLPNGQEFKHIIATCRPDNPRSIQLLKQRGFDYDKTEDKFGTKRLHYKFDLSAYESAIWY